MRTRRDPKADNYFQSVLPKSGRSGERGKGGSVLVVALFWHRQLPGSKNTLSNFAPGRCLIGEMQKRSDDKAVRTMLFSANSHGRGDWNLKWMFDLNSRSAGLLSAGMKFSPFRNSTASVNFESPLAHFRIDGSITPT